MGIRLNIGGLKLGSSSGSSWNTFWASMISATVENAEPTKVVITFPSAKNLVAADLSVTINGVADTIVSASWTSAVWTVVLTSTIIYGDVIILTFVRTGQTKTVTNNVAMVTEFLAVYNAMTVKPDRDLCTVLNTHVKKLVDDGVWSSLEFYNLRTVGDNTSRDAEINWINPTEKVTLSGASKPLFSAFGGFTGNGTSGYIDTGYNPTSRTKYTQDSACVFFYKKTIGASLKTDWGVVDGNNIANSATHAGDNKLQYNRLNNLNTVSDTVVPNPYTGLWIHNRPDGTKFEIWQGKVKKVTKNIASTGLPNKNIYELAVNEAEATGFSTAEHLLWGAGGELTDLQIASLSDAVDALLTSVNNAVQYDATKWGNSVALADYTTHIARSSFSEYSFAYSGTKLYIKANPSIYASFPLLSYLTVYVNGVFNQRVTYSTFIEKEIILPSGLNKTVKIVTGVNTMPVATYLGIYPTSIRGFSTITPIVPANVSDKIVFLGDSIFNGGNAAYPETQGCARLFKIENDIDIACHIWGYNTLAYCAADAGKIAATVAHIQNLFANATGTKKVICNLGTNDHALNSLSAANYQTYYGNLLDAIHAADASIMIWCVSPILRRDILENATLDDYRTAVGTVCTSRSEYANHIAGKTILSAATDYDDQVHPNTAGGKKLKDAIYAVVYP